MLMKYQPKNIHLLYIDIRSIIDTSLGHSISYNHEKNKFQTLNAVFSVITIFGKKVNRSPEVNGQSPGYFYTTIMR